jgi:hypothetical protein
MIRSVLNGCLGQARMTEFKSISRVPTSLAGRAGSPKLARRRGGAEPAIAVRTSLPVVSASARSATMRSAIGSR